MKCYQCEKDLINQEHAILKSSIIAVELFEGRACDHHTVCFVCLSDMLVEYKADAEQMKCPKCCIPFTCHIKKIPNKPDKVVPYKRIDPDFDPVQHWVNTTTVDEREGMTMVYFAHYEEAELISATSFIRADGPFADEESQENVIMWSGIIGRALYGNGRGRPHHSENEYDRHDGGSRELVKHVITNENPGFRFMLQFGNHYMTNGMHYQSEILQCYVAHCMMMQLRVNRRSFDFPCNSELQYFIGKLLSKCRLPEFVIETFASFGLSLPPDHLKIWVKIWEEEVEAHNGALEDSNSDEE